MYYGRHQTSRMQAIKCVVVGDGYVIYKHQEARGSPLERRIRRSGRGRDDRSRDLAALDRAPPETVTLGMHSLASFPLSWGTSVVASSSASSPRPCTTWGSQHNVDAFIRVFTRTSRFLCSLVARSMAFLVDDGRSPTCDMRM